MVSEGRGRRHRRNSGRKAGTFPAVHFRRCHLIALVPRDFLHRRCDGCGEGIYLLEHSSNTGGGLWGFPWNTKSLVRYDLKLPSINCPGVGSWSHFGEVSGLFPVGCAPSVSR